MVLAGRQLCQRGASGSDALHRLLPGVEDVLPGTTAWLITSLLQEHCAAVPFRASVACEGAQMLASHHPRPANLRASPSIAHESCLLTCAACCAGWADIDPCGPCLSAMPCPGHGSQHPQKAQGHAAAQRRCVRSTEHVPWHHLGPCLLDAA